MFVCIFEVKSEDEKIFDKYGKYKGKFDDGRFLIPMENTKENNKRRKYIPPYGKFLERLKAVEDL